MSLSSDILDTYLLPILTSLRQNHFSTTLSLLLPACFLSLVLANIIHTCFLVFKHRHIPGTIIARLTSLWLYYIAYTGTEASSIESLHQRYGSVVLIAPNEVSVSDGRVLKQVYTENGGYRKALCYRNFDIDGFSSLFSELEKEKRAKRWKAVQGLFSMSKIAKEGEEGIRECVYKWVDLVGMGKNGGEVGNDESGQGKKRVDLLAGARALALDAVTGYLFGRRYGALDELQRQPQREDDNSGISAGLFVDSFVAVGRFFYLPSWAFTTAEYLASTLSKDKKEVEGSMQSVDSYIHSLVSEASQKPKQEEQDATYQSLLLRAGISPAETIAQCKDLMFAGTDSTGMNLATLCWYLCRHPEKYESLRTELQDNPTASPGSLPYLNACVKEALRLSMANPTRMPRVVPSQGLHIPSPSSIPNSTSNSSTDSTFIPPGTIIGLQPYTLHHNATVFPQPKEFIPERWENPSSEMQRDWIPFGLGSRACIARNLAMMELVCAAEGAGRSGVLEGCRVVGEMIEMAEWFNSKVVGGKIEVEVEIEVGDGDGD